MPAYRSIYEALAQTHWVNACRLVCLTFDARAIVIATPQFLSWDKQHSQLLKKSCQSIVCHNGDLVARLASVLCYPTELYMNYNELGHVTDWPTASVTTVDFSSLCPSAWIICDHREQHLPFPFCISPHWCHSCYLIYFDCRGSPLLPFCGFLYLKACVSLSGEGNWEEQKAETLPSINNGINWLWLLSGVRASV